MADVRVEGSADRVELKAVSHIAGGSEVQVSLGFTSCEARILALQILKKIGYSEQDERLIPMMMCHVDDHMDEAECRQVWYESYEYFMDYADLEDIIMFNFGPGVVYETEDPNKCNAYFHKDAETMVFVKKFVKIPKP